MHDRLFGLTTHQTYRYFRLYPLDSCNLKTFVSARFGDVGKTLTSVATGYHASVRSFLYLLPKSIADRFVALGYLTRFLDIFHTVLSIHIW